MKKQPENISNKINFPKKHQKQVFRKKRSFLLFLLPNIVFIYLIIQNSVTPLPALKKYSKTIHAEDGTLLSAYLSEDDKWRMETKTEDVPKELITAIIEKEDKYFYYHPGVNPVAIVRAAFTNIIYGKRTSGASTLSMQLARLMNPKERTYSSKFYEMLRALQLEWHFSKKEILEMYMSYIPFGGNVEGIKAASYIYFQRPPAKLSLAQSVLLTVIPNKPNTLRPDKMAEEAQHFRDKWLKNFAETDVFPENLVKEALDEPVFAKRRQLANEAPHFSRFIKDNFYGNSVHTTLNLSLQHKAEKLVKNHVNRVKQKGVSNASVLVIDNRTMEVKAYCGSADFADASIAGQVNGVRAYRSPGSALKPALFALAIDKGIITPKLKLQDIPTNIGGYEPENYDLTYNGEVTAEFALVQSLNIPAVRLLNDIGTKDFIHWLGNEAGFKKVKSMEKKLGISAILGGCDVSLEELTNLYTAFANVGVFRNKVFIKDAKPNKSQKKQLFSPEAAFLILEILSQNQRPDLPVYLLEESQLPRIAWKTGTSYGKKDAWAVGMSPQYTIGVWMGNFNGEGAPELSGAEMAVPLLFDLFNAIDYKSITKNKWFIRPAGIYNRKVCRETGKAAAQDCELQLEDFYIKGVSSAEVCDLYRQFYVSKNETLQFCTACLPATGYHKKKFPQYAPELALWYHKNNKGFTMPPPHNSQCEGKFSSDGPKILSPAIGFEYFVNEDINNKQNQLLLQAAAAQDVNTLYWYINDKFYSKCAATEKLFFSAKPGKHKISCMDDKGRTESVVLVVRGM